MPKLVQLSGKVPISVTVDLDARRVTEVRVLDEEAELDPLRFENDDEWAEAEDIAGDVDWPAWQFGR